MGDNTIIGIRGSSQDNSAMTVGDARSLFLSCDGSRPMAAKTLIWGVILLKTSDHLLKMII